MYRILVADDEGLMLESIRHTIDMNFGSDCEIVTVKSGREVVEQAQNFHPDIAFLDIQMPGLSGIQAIREIRKFDNSIIFIIITAYDRFAYAQEAISLGVMEFLTKPVNRKAILDVCVKAMNRVDEAKKRRSDDLKIREKLEIVIPVIENSFINSIIQEDSTIDTEYYLEMLNIPDRNCYMIVLEFGEDNEQGRLTNALGSSVRMNSKYDSAKETIHSFFTGIAGPVMGNRIVVYVPYAGEKMPYEKRVEIISRVRNMMRSLESTLDLSFRAGISDVRPAADANTAYKAAIRSLHGSRGHLVHEQDLYAMAGKNEVLPDELEERYIRLGMKGDITGASVCASELIERLSEKNASEEEIAGKVMSLLVLFEQKVKDNGLLRKDYMLSGSYLQAVQDAAWSKTLPQTITEFTKEICEEITSSREKEQASVVSQAIAYINGHFHEDLTLDEVARSVDISPYYFSRLFKQETGENFIEYLTDTRIKRAKEYLLNPKYSIKEVCYMCGYSDPNYFSRIFRRYEGVTPSEYRK